MVFLALWIVWMAGPPPSHCIPTTTNALAPSPVFMPPPETYAGKRAVPAYGQPDIPVNAPQVAC